MPKAKSLVYEIMCIQFLHLLFFIAVYCNWKSASNDNLLTKLFLKVHEFTFQKLYIAQNPFTNFFVWPWRISVNKVQTLHSPSFQIRM